MIYITRFDHESERREITAPSINSGFNSLTAVELEHGVPVCSGKRTRTYPGLFFSDYPIQLPKKIEVSFF